MRKIMLMLGLMIVLFSGVVSAEWTGNLNDGLFLYYNHNEGGGTTLNEEVFGIHNGGFYGITGWSEGIIGNSTSYEGGNTQIGYVDSLSIYTVSTWFNIPFDVDSETQGMYLIETNVPAQQIAIGEDTGLCGDELITVFMYSERACYVSDTEQILSGWHHLVVVWNEIEERYEIYLDGEKKSNFYHFPLIPQDQHILTAEYLRLGSIIGRGNEYSGLIDETGFWSRSLTEEEIIQLYNGGEGITLDKDGDGDGFNVFEGDCDDTNPNINPDADEICDGIDNDCDGVIDIPGCRIDSLETQIQQLQTQIQQLQQNDNCIFGFIEKIWEFIFGEPMPSCSAGGGGVGEIGGDTGDAGGDVVKGKKK